uniref:Uncharacterized protein n=1 Tax=Cajanus cajan TaxID=3821 RepID=A0A151RBI0_CAJCA|nr:hypothetical protein KK1_038708 [Cajanus cajan]
MFNKEVFGNIFKKKEELESLLKGFNDCSKNEIRFISFGFLQGIDAEKLRVEALNFFKDLFCSKEIISTTFSDWNLFFFMIFWNMLLLVSTLIVLIPTKDYQFSLHDFQSISLCNIVYKLISKILVNKARSIFRCSY